MFSSHFSTIYVGMRMPPVSVCNACPPAPALDQRLTLEIGAQNHNNNNSSICGYSSAVVGGQGGWVAGAHFAAMAIYNYTFLSR